MFFFKVLVFDKVRKVTIGNDIFIPYFLSAKFVLKAIFLLFQNQVP
jgi:hypothetical protein